MNVTIGLIGAGIIVTKRGNIFFKANLATIVATIRSIPLGLAPRIYARVEGPIVIVLIKCPRSIGRVTKYDVIKHYTTALSLGISAHIYRIDSICGSS